MKYYKRNIIYLFTLWIGSQCLDATSVQKSASTSTTTTTSTPQISGTLSSTGCSDQCSRPLRDIENAKYNQSEVCSCNSAYLRDVDECFVCMYNQKSWAWILRNEPWVLALTYCSPRNSSCPTNTSTAHVTPLIPAAASTTTLTVTTCATPSLTPSLPLSSLVSNQSRICNSPNGYTNTGQQHRLAAEFCETQRTHRLSLENNTIASLYYGGYLNETKKDFYYLYYASWNSRDASCQHDGFEAIEDLIGRNCTEIMQGNFDNCTSNGGGGGRSRVSCITLGFGSYWLENDKNVPA